MKKVLLLLVLCLPIFAAEEKEPVKKPYNVNAYDWTAVSRFKTLSGSGESTRLSKVLIAIQRELDSQAKAGKIADKTEFAVDINWKGKLFKRRFTAHKQYPVELPRGPNKKDK